MTEISNNNYINKENVILAQEINGKYFLTLASGNIVMVSQAVYESIIG